VNRYARYDRAGADGNPGRLPEPVRTAPGAPPEATTLTARAADSVAAGAAMPHDEVISSQEDRKGHHERAGGARRCLD